MSKAVDTHTTSRRRLLSGSAALTLAAVGAAGLASCDPLPALGAENAQTDTSADAALIVACEEFNAIQRQIKALFAAPYEHLAWKELRAYENARGEQQHALRDLQVPIMERIVSLPCRTVQGQRALAECYALQVFDQQIADAGHGDGLVDDPEDNSENRVLLALVRGVLGRA